MDEYIITVSVVAQIRAKNREQAQELADWIMKNIEIPHPPQRHWMETWDTDITGIEIVAVDHEEV